VRWLDTSKQQPHVPIALLEWKTLFKIEHPCIESTQSTNVAVPEPAFSNPSDESCGSAVNKLGTTSTQWSNFASNVSPAETSAVHPRFNALGCRPPSGSASPAGTGA
jgi:hypothetical protein